MISVTASPIVESRVTPVGDGIVRRTTLGTVANLMTQLINAVGQIVLVPLFLTMWGTERYGEWLTLSAAVAYLWMLDFGLQTYTVNRMNQCYSRGESREFVRILHSSLLFALLVSGAALLVVGAALSGAPLNAWFHLSSTPPPTVRLVCLLLLGQTVAGVPFGVLIGVYRSVGEYSRGCNISNAQRVASLIAVSGALWAGGGLAAVALAQFAPTLAFSLGYVPYDLRRRHPEVQLGIRAASLSLAFSFLGASGLFFMIQLALVMVLQGSTLLVGAVLGTLVIPVFVSLRTLANLIRQLTTSIWTAIWPEMTRLDAQGQFDRLREMHALLAKMLLAVVVYCSLAMHVVGPDIVSIWTRGRVTYDGRLLDAFLILTAVQTWWMTSSLLLISSNRQKKPAFYQLIAGTAGLALGYALSRRWGAAGVVYGLILADVALCGWAIPYTACRVLGQSLSSFAANVLGRGALVFVPVAALVWVAGNWLAAAGSLVRFALGGPVLLGISAALVLGFWLHPGERRRIASLLPRKYALPRSVAA